MLARLSVYRRDAAPWLNSGWQEASRSITRPAGEELSEEEELHSLPEKEEGQGQEQGAQLGF